MPKVTFIEASGETIQIEVPVGRSLMQAAASVGLEGIAAECSGSCVCGTCHCYIESHAELLVPPKTNEAALLEYVAAERQSNSRLACQIKVSQELDGIVVRLPVTQI